MTTPQTPQIQPIPTTYRNVRFRSRLEARWAVFYDALGLEWHYEHEGYQLPSGWYVPDFWIPRLHAYIEIKAVLEFGCLLRCAELADHGFLVACMIQPEVAPYKLNGGLWRGFDCLGPDAVWSQSQDGSFILTPFINAADIHSPALKAAYQQARTTRFW